MRGDEERGGKTREMREEMRGGSKQRRKGETVCLCASLPLGSNLGPHSTQEGGTPQIQQPSVLDSGAPATDKESAGDQIEMRQIVAKSDVMSSLVPRPHPGRRGQ